MLPAKAPVKTCLLKLFDELIEHDGYGNLKVEIRLLRRGQKEVIIDCGKQYRFVVDFQPNAESALPQDATASSIS
ncbi:MAG: hypothetical protein ACAH12_08175 [Methylophilaceae bacterium]|uniref:hypothetical protein n=1 Tax=Methylovorus sp. MM2 TaxID=1848038 RepID=UPI0007DE6F8F|nr:hypothetical protein [Methylovorus sp. MM2]OAM53110.1 hypothetical protein A7981_06750 [Methylovorus sp. MM2]